MFEMANDLLVLYVILYSASVSKNACYKYITLQIESNVI